VCRFLSTAWHRASRSLIIGHPLPRATLQAQVLTVRGRTGAVLLMAPIQQERTDAVASALQEYLPDAARSQVRFLCSDDPSKMMFEGLKASGSVLLALAPYAVV
jgi:hypothetical protein